MPIPPCAICGRAIGHVCIVRQDGSRMHVGCASVAMTREIRALRAGKAA